MRQSFRVVSRTHLDLHFATKGLVLLDKPRFHLSTDGARCDLFRSALENHNDMKAQDRCEVVVPTEIKVRLLTVIRCL